MRVAIVKNIVAPYTSRVFAALADRPDIELLVIYETAMEANRAWRVPEDLPFEHVICSSVTLDLRRVVDDAFVHMARGIRGHVRRFRPDAVIASGAGSWSSPANWQVADLAAYVPWYESFPGSQSLRRRIAAPVMRRWVQRGDAWVAAGSRSREGLVALGANPERVAISPIVPLRPILSSDRPSGNESRSGRSVLFVGQLIDRKGVIELLDAFAGLPSSRLLIAGDGPLSETVRNRASREANIQYLGHLEWDELQRIYRQVDALVLPSHYEVWGLVVHEALEHGLPVVVSDAVGAAADLVDDRVNGRIVPPGRVDALREALQDVLSWDAKHRAKGVALSKQRLSNWTLERAVDGLHQAATWAIAARPTAHADRSSSRSRARPSTSRANPRILVIKNIRSPNTDVVFEEMNARLGDDFRVVYEASTEANRQWSIDSQPSFSHYLIPSTTVDLRRIAPDAFLHFPHGTRHIGDWEPEVVIASGGGAWSSPANLIAMAKARKHDWAVVPWWGSFENPLSPRGRWAREPLVRAFIGRGDAWAAYGRRARDFLVSRGADAQRIFISPNIARQPCVIGESNRNRSTFLFVGQLIHRKGLDVLLDAVEESPDVRLRVAGSGPMEPLVRQVAERTSRVTLLGHLDWPELEREYLTAQALILPARYETWGLVVNEALDHGLPVIVSPGVGAADDLVRQDINGVVAPLTVDGLQRAMADVTSWTSERMATSGAVSRAIMEAWSVDRAASGLIDAATSGLEHRQRLATSLHR